jgi:hypothetical protein
MKWICILRFLHCNFKRWGLAELIHKRAKHNLFGWVLLPHPTKLFGIVGEIGIG